MFILSAGIHYKVVYVHHLLKPTTYLPMCKPFHVTFGVIVLDGICMLLLLSDMPTNHNIQMKGTSCSGHKVEILYFRFQFFFQSTHFTLFTYPKAGISSWLWTRPLFVSKTLPKYQNVYLEHFFLVAPRPLCKNIKFQDYEY